MKKIFNSQTITIKTNAISKPHEVGVQTFWRFDKEETELEHDALHLIVGGGFNQLREEYNLDGDKDLGFIHKKEEELNRLLFEMKQFLKQKKSS